MVSSQNGRNAAMVWHYFFVLSLSYYKVGNWRSEPLGDTFITESKNTKKLRKRANPEEPLDKNSKPKQKKRFGKSIKNHCPGYFQARVKEVFEATGGTYKEVPLIYFFSHFYSFPSPLYGENRVRLCINIIIPQRADSGQEIGIISQKKWILLNKQDP